MVEPIMYLAIGFLVSMLFGLMIVPLVHNRAVRLTTRRLEAATPLSMAEIQADKDQLARGIRDVGAAARDERRSAQEQDHQPARRTRQEVRRDQPHEDRARRKERHDLFAGSAREGGEGAVARHRRGIRRQDRGAARRRAGADRQAERTCQDQCRIVRPFDDGGEPPGRTGGGAHPDRRAARAASATPKRNLPQPKRGSRRSAANPKTRRAN